jgi:hypothetical protein
MSVVPANKGTGGIDTRKRLSRDIKCAVVGSAIGKDYSIIMGNEAGKRNGIANRDISDEAETRRLGDGSKFLLTILGRREKSQMEQTFRFCETSL